MRALSRAGSFQHGVEKAFICTYSYLCLPVITGDIANHIPLLLQANIRKAGTVGTPSVPRTTASSTVGTVFRAGAGARRVTRSSSPSACLRRHLSSVRLRCHPAVFAVRCRPCVVTVMSSSRLRRLTRHPPAVVFALPPNMSDIPDALSAPPAGAVIRPSRRHRRHLSTTTPRRPPAAHRPPRPGNM